MRKFGRYLLKAVIWQIILTGIAAGVLLVMIGPPDLSVMGSVVFLGGLLLASLVTIPIYMAYEWAWEKLIK
jgi:hypothetical protein